MQLLDTTHRSRGFLPCSQGLGGYSPISGDQNSLRPENMTGGSLCVPGWAGWAEQDSGRQARDCRPLVAFCLLSHLGTCQEPLPCVYNSIHVGAKTRLKPSKQLPETLSSAHTSASSSLRTGREGRTTLSGHSPGPRHMRTPL